VGNIIAPSFMHASSVIARAAAYGVQKFRNSRALR
jgi:hypothetical protein